MPRRVALSDVDTADATALRELGQAHMATGRPVLVRHPKLAAKARGSKACDLAGLLALFGKTNVSGSGFAYNLKLAAKTIFRDDMLDVAARMGLTSSPGAPGLDFVGERLRYGRAGKPFHAGPGFNFKMLLMLAGAKRWTFVAPEHSSRMASFEEDKCGVRSASHSLDDAGVPEIHEGTHDTGVVLLMSSQWWHATENETEETWMLGTKLLNTRVYSEAQRLRKVAKEAAGAPCSPKSEANVLGTLMWSHSFLGDGLTPK